MLTGLCASADPHYHTSNPARKLELYHFSFSCTFTLEHEGPPVYTLFSTGQLGFGANSRAFSSPIKLDAFQ